MCKKELKVSNIRREELLHKGFLSIKEIREFIPCGPEKASQIYHEIRKKNTSEGVENLFEVVLAKKVLPYIGMTKAEVSSAAKVERSLSVCQIN